MKRHYKKNSFDKPVFDVIKKKHIQIKLLTEMNSLSLLQKKTYTFFSLRNVVCSIHICGFVKDTLWYICASSHVII